MFISTLRDNCISASNQRHFVNLKSTSKFNVETTLIQVDPKSNFLLMLYHLKNCNLNINAEKKFPFQCRSNVILAMLNHSQNLTLVVYYLEYLDILNPKCHTRKINNIYGDFKRYQVFMHNFLPRNVLIPLNRILSAHTKNIFITSQLYQ